MAPGETVLSSDHNPTSSRDLVAHIPAERAVLNLETGSGEVIEREGHPRDERALTRSTTRVRARPQKL